MTCPECNRKTHIVETRFDDDSVRRRRECRECGYRFTTLEVDKDLYERLVKAKRESDYYRNRKGYLPTH